MATKNNKTIQAMRNWLSRLERACKSQRPASIISVHEEQGKGWDWYGVPEPMLHKREELINQANNHVNLIW